MVAAIFILCHFHQALTTHVQDQIQERLFLNNSPYQDPSERMFSETNGLSLIGEDLTVNATDASKDFVST